MPIVKNVAKIAEKWARVTPQRSADYEAGVKDPIRDWATNTGAAVNAYKEGITKSITNNSFQKGVAKAGTDKWKRKAVEVGPQRFAQGVQVAQPDFEKGWHGGPPISTSACPLLSLATRSSSFEVTS